MENLFAFKHWLLSGPQMARTIRQFEKLIEEDTCERLNHCEQKAHIQKAFFADVKALLSTISEMGKPFLDESSDLLVLDTRDIQTQL